ncbi:MAG TPA: hypothetical protein VHQ45_11910, partial [Gemmatimonadaceae bacterium]|nr:hypothetical protein [Gemmatimonadaceae bacterium]
RDVDGRSDIYALGVLGYLMLAGELPFRATNTPAMLMKHISEPPPSLASRHPELPAGLVAIVERALCKKPEERWADAAGMRDALLGRSAQRSVPAVPAVSPAAAPTIAVPPAAPPAAPPSVPAAASAAAPAAAPALDQPGDAFPHPAPLGGGGAHTRELFRQERRLWRERVQERERREALAPWAPAAPPPPVTPTPAKRVRETREQQALERFRLRPIEERISSFRRRLVGSVAVIGVLTVVNMATFPFPWVIFPAMGMFGRLRRRWQALRDQGVTWSDVWLGRVPPHLAGGNAPPAQTRAEALAARAHARTQAIAERRGELWADLAALQRRVRSMRRWALTAALLPVGGLGVALAAEAGEPFVFSLVLGTAVAAVAATKAGRLRRLGLRTRDLLRGGWQQTVAAADPRPRSAIAAAEAVRLVPADVLGGAYGAAVRRAAEDRAQVREALAKLAPTDRQLIPDVQPTVDALVERVALLAQALHRLDADLPADLLPALTARLAAARAEPAATADRERRLQLLERQRATIEDLVRRRATLSGQLESASLVLQSVKLDLLKLRSAGVQAALEDVTSATQEARALSRDIGHVLDAAAEVRAL